MDNFAAEAKIRINQLSDEVILKTIRRKTDVLYRPAKKKKKRKRNTKIKKSKIAAIFLKVGRESITLSVEALHP